MSRVTLHSARARALDDALTRGGVPAGSRARTLARIRGGERRAAPRIGARVRASVWVGLGLAAGAAAVLLWSGRAGSPTPAARGFSTVVVAEATAPVQPPPCATHRDGRLVLDGSCSFRLGDPRLTVASLGTSTLRTEPGMVAVDAGWVVFDVDPVKDGPPVRIEVVSGTIEVLGTRFSVYQDDVRGHVELVEGRIRMLDRAGGTTLLQPGDRYAWLNAEPPAPVAPASPKKRARPPEKAAAIGSLDDIARLRAKGRYRDALALIDRLLGDHPDPRAAAVLHYEAGTILEEALRDREAACRHWAEHRRRFPGGRYDSKVARRLERLDCPSGGN